MVLFHNKPNKLAIIAGKYILSGSCTDMIGGICTAGAATAAEASARLTWIPAFVSAPICVATINSGPKTVSSPVVYFTGVGVSNAYIVCAAGGGAAHSGATIGFMLVGEAKL